MQRRTFLKLGALGTGLFFVGAARSEFARAAQARRVAIPTVDRLILTSTIDGSYDAVLPGGRMGTITVERTTGTQPSLVSEHGLGYYLESFVGDDRRAILLDFGNTYENLSRNFSALKVDAASVDGLILSHGHADHFGGFLSLGDATPEWAERELALYAGGEDTFLPSLDRCSRWKSIRGCTTG
jgi:7,8-dihydropterin-6-yl-methyl-4-(beta-D-ribofuranosyl)aminobenzene 5'-phosphate synthase